MEIIATNFIAFSNNFLSLNIVSGIQIYHIIYFLIIVDGIQQIFKIIRR